MAYSDEILRDPFLDLFLCFRGTIAVHSLEFLNAGKGEEAHEAVLIAAKVLSGTACDLTENPALLEEIQAEFRENQEKHS